MKTKQPKRRNAIARDVRTPKYAPRVVADKRKQASRAECRQSPVTLAGDRYGLMALQFAGGF